MLTELRKRIDLSKDYFNKVLETIKKTQPKIYSSIFENKSTPEEANSWLNDTEECISDLEDRIMEITQSEQQIERQMKKNESNVQDLWDNIKCANLHIVGVPEGEETENEIENVFEEIMAENFLNL